MILGNCKNRMAENTVYFKGAKTYGQLHDPPFSICWSKRFQETEWRTNKQTKLSPPHSLSPHILFLYYFPQQNSYAKYNFLNFNHQIASTVSVLWQNKEYMVRYTLSLGEFPRAKPEGTLKGKGYIWPYES